MTAAGWTRTAHEEEPWVEALRVGKDPRRMGPYELLGRLGNGHIGKTYLGRSLGDETVVVSLFHRQFASDEAFRRRLAESAAALRRVDGSFTAPVVHVNAQAERPWLASTFVAGLPLAEAVAEYGALSPELVAALGAGLVRALQDMHAAGVVHGGLKPSHVLLTADGPRLTGLGLVPTAEASALAERGVLVGTPEFMAPEQLLGIPAQAASDVFLLGAVLVFASTGHPPFGDGPRHELARRVAEEEPELEGITPPLRALFAGCLAPEPADRPSLTSLLADLAALAHPAVDSAQDGSRAEGSAGGDSVPMTGWLPPTLATEVHARAARPIPFRPLKQSRRSVLVGGLATGAAMTVIGHRMWQAWSGPDSRHHRWKYDLPSGGFGIVRYGAAGGLLCIGYSNGLHGVDAATGELHWTLGVTDNWLRISPVPSTDGTVFVHSGGGMTSTLWAVDAVTGESKWTFPLSQFGGTSPGVADKVVYVGGATPDFCLWAIDAATGETRWKVPTTGMVFSAPTVSDDVVYCSMFDGGLWAVDAATGKRRWAASTGGDATTAQVVDGLVYVGSDKGLHAVDAVTGKQRWIFSRGHATTPAVVDGTIFTGINASPENGALYAVDAVTGKQRWRFDTGGRATDVAVADGSVYVGGGDELYAVDAEAGYPRWTFSAPYSADCSSPVVAHSMVYAGFRHIDGVSVYALRV